MPDEDTAAREQAQRVKAIVEKVEVFKRLSLGEAQRLLKLCSYKAYGTNEMVYRAGDASEEMLILLQGRLQVLTEDGTVLGEILPGSVTGEMGVLTGEPRSATILASEAASGFVLRKSDLTTLLRDDAIRLKVMENMVGILIERLRATNTQLESYARKSREM
ncbi:MAG: cyclic nucleotide-binding domain-containing protein, partial [Candidatus Latescibacteria bacterium]|jgi:CRP-like cAMP-binding protein|nr:cyclic nucleotide-binding domain-containing protein [Candidatus Latescibacterota bacterium]